MTRRAADQRAGTDHDKLPPDDAGLAHVLVAIQDGDNNDALLDNDGVAATCELSLEVVAHYLDVAKQRSFIWGSRGARQPAPWFTDLELTVQGRRFLAGGQHTQ